MQDPIAFAWGPDGKLWVVEMGDYPLGDRWQGQVRRTRQVPGVQPKATANTTRRPSSSMASAFRPASCPGETGMLVTCAPDIFYAEDTDGDGKADKKEVLFTGFIRGTSSTASTARLGTGQLDLLSPTATAAASSSRTRPARRSTSAAAICAFRPDDRRAWSRQPAQTQYRPQPRRLGQLVRRQQHQSDVALRARRSLPAAQPALRRRPARRSRRPGHARSAPGSFRSAAPCPASTISSRRIDFTSACSPIVYRDDLFYRSARVSLAEDKRDAYPTWTFVSEPVHNLVHREIMRPRGRHLQQPAGPPMSATSEFLASSDNWFRPAHDPDRTRWLPVGRRHVSRRDRASAVDSAGLAETPRPAGRARHRAAFTACRRWARSRGPSRGSTNSTPPAWSPPSIRPTAGSATWPR